MSLFGDSSVLSANVIGTLPSEGRMDWQAGATTRNGRISLFIKGEENEFVFPRQSVLSRMAHSHSL